MHIWRRPIRLLSIRINTSSPRLKVWTYRSNIHHFQVYLQNDTTLFLRLQFGVPYQCATSPSRSNHTIRLQRTEELTHLLFLSVFLLMCRQANKKSYANNFRVHNHLRQTNNRIQGNASDYHFPYLASQSCWNDNMGIQ